MRLLDALQRLQRCAEREIVQPPRRFDRCRDATRRFYREDPRTLLDRFLATPAAADEEDLGLEAASIRAALDAHVLLYVIDVRGKPKPKHEAELAVLASTARPLIPVLNYAAHSDARPNPWRNVCARHGVHTTLEFDAVVYDDAGEYPA